MRQESSGWAEYEETFPDPVPIPHFYAVSQCPYCKQWSGYFPHHLRRTQFGVEVIRCSGCERYTRAPMCKRNSNYKVIIVDEDFRFVKDSKW